MKTIIFALFAGAALITAGCVKTVSDTHTFASTWSKDTLRNRYQRPIDQVYHAAYSVVQNDGVVVQEYIPHDSTNAVRSILGRVNDCKVWVRVEAVDPQITEVDVQTRSKWGTSNLDLAHEVATEISLQLAR